MRPELFRTLILLLQSVKKGITGPSRPSQKYLQNDVYVRILETARPVEELCYKPEGRGFDSRLCHYIVSTYVILPTAVWPWGGLSL
jgi:hypothetical protein